MVPCSCMSRPTWICLLNNTTTTVTEQETAACSNNAHFDGFDDGMLVMF